jgi:hypothetical protein
MAWLSRAPVVEVNVVFDNDRRMRGEWGARQRNDRWENQYGDTQP